jgi:hypothetical protein
VHTVSRPASSRVPLPRAMFRRIGSNASVSASGVTAAEFIGLKPCLSSSSVSLRSVASVYGTLPRNALRNAFLALRRAAAAKRCRRIAERLARVAGQRIPDAGLPQAEKMPWVRVSQRLQ